MHIKLHIKDAHGLFVFEENPRLSLLSTIYFKHQTARDAQNNAASVTSKRFWGPAHTTREE